MRHLQASSHDVTFLSDKEGGVLKGGMRLDEEEEEKEEMDDEDDDDEIEEIDEMLHSEDFLLSLLRSRRFGRW